MFFLNNLIINYLKILNDTFAIKSEKKYPLKTINNITPPANPNIIPIYVD